MLQLQMNSVTEIATYSSLNKKVAYLKMWLLSISVYLFYICNLKFTFIGYCPILTSIFRILRNNI